MSRLDMRSLVRCAGTVALAVVVASTPSQALAQLRPEDVARLEWIEETAISPDGQWIAYTRSRAAGPGNAARGRPRDLFVIAVEGGDPQQLVSAAWQPGAPTWSPDGALLAFLGESPQQNAPQQVYAVPRNGGEPRPLTSAVTGVPNPLGFPSAITSFAFSPDGRSIAWLASQPASDSDGGREPEGYDAVVDGDAGPHVRLWVKNLVGGMPQAITPADRTVRDFGWSPNGRVFALQVTEDTDWISARNFRRLYTVSAGGGELKPLTRTEGRLGPMAWSPDGSWLAFVGATSLRDSTAQSLFVVPASGGEAVDLTADYEGSVLWVGWRDASTLLFGAVEGTRAVLNRIGRTGGAIERVAGGREESFVFITLGISTGLSLDADARTFAAPMNTAKHPDELYVGQTDGRQPRRLTNHNAFIERIRLARQEMIEWKGADGLRIEGILIHPLEERAEVRYPLVVIPHGGPEAASQQAFSGLTYPQQPGQVFAAHGYAVLYPNYRGSIGRGVAFSRANHGDLGGKDLEDILRGIDHLVARKLVDPDRVAIQGASYGGYLAALAAALHSDRFKAAIASAPVTNWYSYVGSNFDPVHQTLGYWDLWWYEHPGLLMDRSPVAHVRKNWTPLHIDHGASDQDVPLLQSKELYQALRFAGAKTRLVVYPREGHDYVEEAHRVDVIRRYLEWLDQHLRSESRR
jgi:dipeptidyl aminopeptidase/acylaminoacyl peptidase